MSQLSRPLSAHPVCLLALAGALLLAALIALPAPAQAHDTLLSTDPEDGATLETSPEEVTFTFSADILDVSPLVRISDDDGVEVAEIVPTIDGPTATAAVEEPLPAGTYDIQRSEEDTSVFQSRFDLVGSLRLEQKNKMYDSTKCT